ncbi:hypothetical protein ABI_18460 [Asticcacaulis biprosthecium C19]|uniref:Uncharacterized protein n=1 Tax=Asticcacaulis biprosthecium C19 TaxID=715226 RepID=F4QL31_9CAUL|nr:hypothetical protein [Asticcacaulis biprosthecium]EGF93406.1 hypothetical protein ABI_18460 [Asticcacaulis biprosthecium C19]
MFRTTIALIILTLSGSLMASASVAATEIYVTQSSAGRWCAYRDNAAFRHNADDAPLMAVISLDAGELRPVVVNIQRGPESSFKDRYSFTSSDAYKVKRTLSIIGETDTDYVYEFSGDTLVKSPVPNRESPNMLKPDPYPLSYFEGLEDFLIQVLAGSDATGCQ